MTTYRFIQKYHDIFGSRWLLRRLNICPNAYYNYLQDRKSEYHGTKRKIFAEIWKIYHDHGGVDGYRIIRVFLERKNIRLSAPTVHKCMNKELGLLVIVRRKKANHQMGKPHEVFPNLINQNFTADEINQKWCTDSTYLYLTNGSIRYNCSILDLHDRSIIARITDRQIISDLAIRTLKKAEIIQSMSRAGCLYDNAPIGRYYNTPKTN